MFKAKNEKKIDKLIELAQLDEKNKKHFEAIEKYEKAKALLQSKQNFDRDKLKIINHKICEISNMLSILFLQ